MIVTPGGDYVFLEVNEMGAFLWIEEKVEDLGLLDAFCEFLLQGTVDFRWRKSSNSVLWRDVSGHVMREFEIEAPRNHVRISTESIFDEGMQS